MKIIGHRGARGHAPENTIKGLQKAIDLQVDEIEVDVRITADNVPILIHNAKLADGTPVNTLTLAEIRKKNPDTTTLDEAMVYTHRPVRLRIEIKPHVPLAPIFAVIQNHVARNGSTDKYLIASFSQTVLRQARKAFPEIDLVVNERIFGVRATWRARQVNTKLLAMNQRVMWFGFIHAMSRRGYKLTPYTVNNPKQAKRWIRHGLYGVVTDYPERFTGLDKNS